MANELNKNMSEDQIVNLIIKADDSSYEQAIRRIITRNNELQSTLSEVKTQLEHVNKLGVIKINIDEASINSISELRKRLNSLDSLNLNKINNIGEKLGESIRLINTYTTEVGKGVNNLKNQFKDLPSILSDYGKDIEPIMDKWDELIKKTFGTGPTISKPGSLNAFLPDIYALLPQPSQIVGLRLLKEVIADFGTLPSDLFDKFNDLNLNINMSGIERMYNFDKVTAFLKDIATIPELKDLNINVSVRGIEKLDKLVMDDTAIQKIKRLVEQLKELGNINIGNNMSELRQVVNGVNKVKEDEKKEKRDNSTKSKVIQFPGMEKASAITNTLGTVASVSGINISPLMNTMRIANSFTNLARQFINTERPKKVSNSADKVVNADKKIVEQADGAAEGLGALGGVITKIPPQAAVAIVAVTAVIAAIALMGVAGKKAVEQNKAMAQGLQTLGGEIQGSGQLSLQASRDLIHLKNTWSTVALGIENAFIPVFKMFVNAANNIGTILKWAGIRPEEVKTTGTAGAQGLSDYANKMNKYVPTNRSIPAMADVASSAKQSGFTNIDAANLAIGTMNMAAQLQEKYGEDAVDINKKLSDAWLNGSDAAKQYGIVVDDLTLKGWLMQEHGIDAVNVKLSDAALQAYRYELAMEEASNNNSNAIQQNIKTWKQLGTIIDSTKNMLLPFEKVITLPGLNPLIPDVGSTVRSTPEGNLPFTNISISPKLDTQMKFNVQEELEELRKSITPSVDLDIDGLRIKYQEVNNMFDNLNGAIHIPVVFDPTNTEALNNGYNYDTSSNGGRGGGGAFGPEDDNQNTGIKGVLSSIAGKAQEIFKVFNISSYSSIPKLPGLQFGHADGGITLRDHPAMMHKNEVIMPLDSSRSTPVYESIASELSKNIMSTNNSQGKSEIHLHMDGVNVWENTSLMDRFVEKVSNKINTIQRNRGDANYGTHRV